MNRCGSGSRFDLSKRVCEASIPRKPPALHSRKCRRPERRGARTGGEDAFPLREFQEEHQDLKQPVRDPAGVDSGQTVD